VKRRNWCPFLGFLLLIPRKPDVNSERRSTLESICPIARQEVIAYLYYRIEGVLFSEVGTEVLQNCSSTPRRLLSTPRVPGYLPLLKL
jgi:hypothetical protein